MSRSFAMIFAVASVLAAFTNVVFMSEIFAQDWPTYRHDFERTGYSISSAPNTDNLLWKYYVGDVIGPSPAIADGRLVVGANDAFIYCLDEHTGELNWRFETEYEIWCCPTIANGRVFNGSSRYLYCVDAATGDSIWTFFTNTEPGRSRTISCPIVLYGAVWFGARTGYVYCLDEHTAAIMWIYMTTPDVEVRATTFASDRIFAASLDSTIYCLDAWTGSEIWTFSTGGPNKSEIAVFHDKVFFSSRDSRIYCLDASSGALMWSYCTGGGSNSSPAVADGRVFVGSDDRYLYCLDEEDGHLVWTYETDHAIRGGPAVADGKVYIGTNDTLWFPPPDTYYLYCLRASDGEIVWKYPFEDQVYSSPAVANGRVFVASHDGYVYCFGEPQSLSLTLTPDATTVERGGKLGYTVEVTNYTGDDHTIEYWSDVYLWTGEPYKKNPVFGPKQVTIKAGMTKSGHLSHKIPNNAPLKTYTLCGRIGWHPDDVWDEDCFGFTVVVGLGIGQEGNDWEVIESTF